MPSKSQSKKKTLFKSTWNNSETKVVRVPVAFADIVVSVARLLDQGASLEELEQEIHQIQLALSWEEWDVQLQTVLQEIPLARRAAVRQAMMRLVSVMTSQVEEQSDQEASDDVSHHSGEERSSQVTTGVNLEAWWLPENSFEQYLKQCGAHLVSEDNSHEHNASDDVQVRKRIIGIVMLLLNLGRPSKPVGNRALDGAKHYSFLETNHDIYVLDVSSSSPSDHRTILQFKSEVVKGQKIYQIKINNLRVQDIERFAVARYLLWRGLEQAKTVTEKKKLADDVLQYL